VTFVNGVKNIAAWYRLSTTFDSNSFAGYAIRVGRITRGERYSLHHRFGLGSGLPATL
jgi:hypothetical protein